MAKLLIGIKDNPRLEQRALANGHVSLYLVYYLGRQSEALLDKNGEPVLYKHEKMAGKPKYRVRHIRRKESLDLYLKAKPRTPEEKKLNEDTKQLAKKIREQREEQLYENKEEYYIFHLPSDTMCFKALRHWTKRAGIDKPITWHCGRHSFATSLLNNGVNIKVVSSLLGHSSLIYTEKYLRAVDKQKVEAINSLPSLTF